eukprot:TRINITY_DN3939_c0_g1_i1.p1 TRINITY_DN3939_c0_g1~~TRINITY_DN3939_c0_g1_i1.p1  ORF type:complete len:481 (+),score=89.07 TRINITY_DN3939_c0_g1_i1:193-1635(+)
MGNFSSMMCVYLALSLECIAKLQKTWSSGVGSLMNQFTRLSECIRPLHNFAGYREDLRNASSPGIPYMGVLMKDIVSLEEVLSASSRTPSPPMSPTPSSSSTHMSRNAAVISFNNLETTAQVIQSQFLKFKKTKYRSFSLTSDKALIAELLNPASFNLIPEKDMDEVAQLLEHKKRASLKIDMSRLDLQKLGSDSAAPHSAGSRSSPRTPTQYGLRPASASFSAPASPLRLEHLLANTISGQSTPGTSPSMWKGHIERCLAHLHSMKPTDDNKIQYQCVQEVAEAISTAGGAAQVTTGRKKKLHSKFFVDDVTAELDPLGKVTIFESALFSNFPFLLPPQVSEWKREIVVSEDLPFSLHRSKLVSIYSTTLLMITAAVKSLELEHFAGTTRLLVAGSLSHPSATMLHRLTGKSSTKDISAAESAVLSMMGPQAIVDFVALRGSLTVQNNDDGNVQVDIQIVFEVKPEAGLRASAPVFSRA